MKKFIDFIKRDVKHGSLKISSNLEISTSSKRNLLSFDESRSNTSAAVSSCLHLGIGLNEIKMSSGDAGKFSEKVTELAYSEEFLNEFSNEIGSPKKGESEDEFVKRAKNKMANLLRVKLGK